MSCIGNKFGPEDDWPTWAHSLVDPSDAGKHEAAMNQPNESLPLWQPNHEELRRRSGRFWCGSNSCWSWGERGSTASDELSECLMVFNMCAALPFPSFPRFNIFDEQNGGFSNSSINCKTMASCRRTGPGRRVWHGFQSGISLVMSCYWTVINSNQIFSVLFGIVFMLLLGLETSWKVRTTLRVAL